MALQRPNGEYIAIVKGAVTKDYIPYIVHKDAEQRARYKSGTLDKFEQVIQSSVFVPLDFESIADPTKSILDNQVTAAYEALKQLEDFADCEEV